jgi:hypothetical protein
MTYSSSSSCYGNTFLFGTLSSSQTCYWFFSVVSFAVGYLFAFVAVSVARRGSEGEWGACGGVCSVLDVQALSCFKADCKFSWIVVGSRAPQRFVAQ